MAKLEQTLNGDFDRILKKIEDGVLNGSMSASLEDSSDFPAPGPGAACGCSSGTATRAATGSA